MESLPYDFSMFFEEAHPKRAAHHIPIVTLAMMILAITPVISDSFINAPPVWTRNIWFLYLYVC